MDGPLNNISSIVPGIPEIQQSKEIPQIPVQQPEIIATKPVEAPKTPEVHGIGKVETLTDTSEKVSLTASASTPTTDPTNTNKTQPVPQVVNLTKDKTKLKDVPTNAEVPTKEFNQEEEQFIQDVEAAHGNK
jgi:hypothetical protein